MVKSNPTYEEIFILSWIYTPFFNKKRSSRNIYPKLVHSFSIIYCHKVGYALRNKRGRAESQGQDYYSPKPISSRKEMKHDESRYSSKEQSNCGSNENYDQIVTNLQTKEINTFDDFKYGPSLDVHLNLENQQLKDRNGILQRRNSWQDGVYGTTCPIPPGRNFTYNLQVKDQIGSFFYFPSLNFHKAAGGFGAIRILSRPMIPVPFADPAGDYTILIGDWYRANHTLLKRILDGGHKLPNPNGLLINGRGANGASGISFSVEQGKTYRFRISNVGLQNTLNIRFQNHRMTLVEVEGTHTVQTSYSWLDVHVGQSYSVLVTADQPAQDFYIAVSTRFSTPVLTTTAILKYSNSAGAVSGPPPGGPTFQVDVSLNQARSIRTNNTASGPRPNPQGSYHYGLINTTRTIKLANSPGAIDKKQRYGVNSVSFVPLDTPLKLIDFFKLGGFRLGSISDSPSGGGLYKDTAVMAADFRAFVEIVFENHENIVQSWHFDGYSFFVVGMDGGLWKGAESRKQYNLRDAVARCTTQVYPNSWTAIYVALDNVGMWNIRSEFWARQYLGQQFYMRVYSPVESIRDEYPIPRNARLCGRAAGRHTRPL